MTDNMHTAENENTNLNDITTWEDIDKIREVLSGGIVDLANNINSLISTYKDQITANLTEDELKTLALNLNMFKKDIETVSKDIGKIYLKHKGKTGKIESEVDLADAINIQLQYIGMKELFFTVINPAYINIVEMIQKAADRMENNQEDDSKDNDKDTDDGE